MKLKACTSIVKPEKKKTFSLQHSDIRPYISLKTMQHTGSLGCTVLPHPQYSPVKDGLCSQHFPSNDVIIAVVKQQVTGTDFYKYYIQALDQGCQKHS